MMNGDRDKGSATKLIMDYRRRQQRAERMLLAFWIGVMVMIVGAGYMVYKFLQPDLPESAVAATDTPAAASQPVTENAPLAAGPGDTPGAPATTAAPPAADPALAASAAAASPIFTPLPTEAPASGGMVTYAVKEGDSVYSIAAQFGVDFTTILQLNPQITPEFLNVGDELTVPAGFASPATATAPLPANTSIVEYKVAAGDVLAIIAANFGTTVDAIVLENGLASPDQIQEGQVLRIPVPAGVTPSAAAFVPSPTPSPTATP